MEPRLRPERKTRDRLTTIAREAGTAAGEAAAFRSELSRALSFAAVRTRGPIRGTRPLVQRRRDLPLAAFQVNAFIGDACGGEHEEIPGR